MGFLLDAIFATTSILTALAAIVAMLRAGKANQSIKSLRIEVNSRLDQLVTASRAEGKAEGRANERAERKEDRGSRYYE